MPAQAKRYLAAPDMPYGTRAAVVGGLFIVGVTVQLLLSSVVWGVLVGCGFVVAGSVFLFARNVTNKAVVGRRRKWENVTMTELDRAGELCRKTKEWSRDFLSISSGRGFLVLVVLGFAVWLVGQFVRGGADTALSVAWYVDAGALLIPLWFSGRRTGWTPPHLNIKLKALDNIRAYFEMTRDPDTSLQPMLEVCENAKGEAVPGDARFMVRFGKAPENFIGVQIQVSLNDVQGTKYPYVYCVVLAKQGFGLPQRIRGLTVAKGDIIEVQNEPEVEVVVVRQHTTRKTGYHTNPNAQRRVYASAMGLANAVVKNAAAGQTVEIPVAGGPPGPARPSPRPPSGGRKRRT